MKMSKSKVNSFLKCRREFKYNYIDGIEMPPNEYMAFGTLMHEYAEKIAKFLKKIQDEGPGLVEEDINLAMMSVIDEDTLDSKTKSCLENLENFFYRSLFVYEYSIFSIEDYIHDTDVDLSGLADIVFEDENGDLIVVDYKTAKSQSIKKYRLELCYYKKLLEFQYPDKEVVTAGIYFIKDNGYRFLNFTDNQKKGSYISKEDYQAAMELLDYVRDEIDKGVFLPTRQYTCQFCCYKELCERDGNF